MPLILNEKVLVLDKNFRPIRITNVKGAVYLVFREAANVIDQEYNVFEVDEWIRHSKHRTVLDSSFRALRSVDSVFGVPKAIILRNYIQKKPREPVCTKMNVFIRDMYTCQYCDVKLSQGNATIDHVVPRARGGDLTWTNAATSCRSCNNSKGSKSLARSGMKLKKELKPLMYNLDFFQYYARRFNEREWYIFLGVKDGKV